MCSAFLAVFFILCAVPIARAAAAQGLRDGEAFAPQGLHAVGPPLTALPTKLADRDWLVAWLLKPSRLRRPPIMRNLHISVNDARAIAKYLFPRQVPRLRRVRWRGGDRRRGAQLFVTRGCRGCHAIESNDPSASPRVPNLAGIGLKVRGDWLFTWIKAPRSYNPDTAMPQLVLSDDDVRDLVAFLLSHREGADVVATAPRFDPGADVEAGRAAIDRFDCAKCHQITGFQTVAPTRLGSFAARVCSSCHEPGMSATTPAPAAPSADEVIENGRLLLAHYNCRGCHRLAGSGGMSALLERKTFAPPVLDGEGARVQRSWLIDFLRHPRRLRPWLEMQMPDFGFSEAEAMALASYFAVMAHVPFNDEPPERAAVATIALGERRFTHFHCRQCHPADSNAPLREGIAPEDLSINLAVAKSRLRPSWVRDFLAHPKSVVGNETRMPAVFYSIGGVAKVEQPERDIAAITAYLFAMPTLPTHPTIDGQSTPRDWTNAPY